MGHYLKHNSHQQHWAVKFNHLWTAVVGGASMNDYFLHNPCSDGSTVVGNIGPCYFYFLGSRNIYILAKGRWDLSGSIGEFSLSIVLFT